MSFSWLGTSAYWCGWWHWYIGISFQIRKTIYHWGFGYHSSPRYCITWLGALAYWHMHWKDEAEFTSGWSWNCESYHEVLEDE